MATDNRLNGSGQQPGSSPPTRRHSPPLPVDDYSGQVIIAQLSNRRQQRCLPPPIIIEFSFKTIVHYSTAIICSVTIPEKLTSSTAHQHNIALTRFKRLFTHVTCFMNLSTVDYEHYSNINVKN